VNSIQYKQGKEKLLKSEKNFYYSVETIQKGAGIRDEDIITYDSATTRIFRHHMINKLFNFDANNCRTDTEFILRKEFIDKTSERFRLRKTAEKEEKFSLHGDKL
jgi:hypothetical protein